MEREVLGSSLQLYCLPGLKTFLDPLSTRYCPPNQTSKENKNSLHPAKSLTAGAWQVQYLTPHTLKSMQPRECVQEWKCRWNIFFSKFCRENIKCFMNLNVAGRIFRGHIFSFAAWYKLTPLIGKATSDTPSQLRTNLRWKALSGREADWCNFLLPYLPSSMA